MEMPWVWLHNWNFNLIFQNMHLLTYFFFLAQVETVNAGTAQMMKCMSLKKTASQILLIFSNILLLWGKHPGSENGLNLILLQNASQSLQKNSQMSPSGKQHVEMSLKNKYLLRERFTFNISDPAVVTIALQLTWTTTWSWDWTAKQLAQL